METCKYGLGASTRKPPTARWVWRWVLSPHLYEKGYNIVFKVNEANEVTVESQPAWKHASYGEVFVSGKGALEDGVITVKLSHDVPKVGGFGEFKEILYLPAK